jgi:hypothetical protein
LPFIALFEINAAGAEDGNMPMFLDVNDAVN